MINNKKISFMVIGAQKSGTSALYSYCKKHAQIGTGIHKEVHFFDKSEVIINNEVDVNAYHANFDFSDTNKVYGDFTPDYIYFQESAKLIWEYNPKIKLIAILRNPIERAFSHWNMQSKPDADVVDPLSFSEAIRNERQRCRAYLPEQHGHFSYIDRGFYSEQIRRFQHFFPKEQLLFIKYDDFQRDQEKTLRNIFSFIGVNPNQFVYEHQRAFEIPYSEIMKEEDRDYLTNLFTHEIHSLEELLGWDCANWLNKSKTDNM